jgi:hypothetical protein
VPKITKELKNEKEKLFNDEDCSIKHTNLTKYNLKSIVVNQERIVEYTLWTSIEGNYGKIELMKYFNDSFLRIVFNDTKIFFYHEEVKLSFY